jgi:hypothetical protein
MSTADARSARRRAASGLAPPEIGLMMIAMDSRGLISA